MPEGSEYVPGQPLEGDAFIRYLIDPTSAPQIKFVKPRKRSVPKARPKEPDRVFVPGQPLMADAEVPRMIDRLRRASMVDYKAGRNSDGRAIYSDYPDPREIGMQILSVYNPQGVLDPLGGALDDVDQNPDYDNPVSRGVKALGKRVVLPALDAMNATGKVRDAQIVALQDAVAGNYGKAALRYLNSPRSAFQAGGVAPGSAGSPDDWRTDAEQAGMSPGGIMFLDFAADPGMYLGAPLAKAGLKAAGDLADVARYVRSGMKYGFTGIPTEIVDNAGNVFRVRNSLPGRPGPALSGLLPE